MQVASHAPASRPYTSTSPAYPKMHSSTSPLAHSQSHTGSSYSIQSAPSSRSSDTTQGTSASTLFPPPLPTSTPTNGNIEPTNNVMNKIADKETSLFQICMVLRQRLIAVPGFDTFLHDEEAAAVLDDQGAAADHDVDIVTLLWRTFRRGRPLCALYDTLRPDQPISVDVSKYNPAKQGKALTSSFLRYCINELQFSVEDCFIIYDLYGDDTTGFVKVTKMVSRLLDIMVHQGIIEDVRPDEAGASAAIKRSQRQHIVDELVTTERTYVQHLELLQAFKQLCDSKGIIGGDVSHQIFHNLDALLNVQRRFLIRVEQINAQPEAEQNWGKVFISFSDAFQVYEPYIANQKLCEETVIREFGALREAGGTVEMRQMVESPPTFHGFLMKPFQRLTKYPLLLNELHRKGDFDEERKADLLKGKEFATAVLTRTNTAIDNQDKLEAVEELKGRVEDWKGHRVEGFGNLLLFGTYTVLKSDNALNKDPEREYHVYFFESILLCCKDIDRNKPKNKISTRPLVDKKGKPKMQLKGRIFMQNVTDVLKASKSGTYTCQIFWKGDPGIENFIIRFVSEETLNKWYNTLLEQRKICSELSRPVVPPRPAGTSVTEFTYMQNQGDLENPYQQEDEEDDDDDAASVAPTAPFPSYSPASEFYASQNASSTSLRSRSATGDSGPNQLTNGGLVRPYRLPPGSIGQPALTLRTQQLPGYLPSPAEKLADSYFSPTMDSPMSSRTSTSSSIYPFPRQAVPTNGYYEEGHGRYTAPVMSRTASRENPAAANAYPANARGITPRPSFPAGTGMHSSQQTPASRNRSVSSPDVNNAQRRAMNGHRPPVPDMPPQPYQAQHMPISGPVSRSLTNSPSLANGLPPRGTQSPKLQRDWAETRPRPDLPQFGHDNSGAPLTDPRIAHMSAPRSHTPIIGAMSPPLPSSAEAAQPTQLKVKVHATAAGQVLTLVVPTNIAYQSLKDRIDAKLQRSTNMSLSDRTANQVKLKYLDEDDYVSIQSDEDVQTAFETWREQRGEGIGGMGEIELYCQ
ncbi:hypothetical protein MBLNU459_g1042t1 [Dothideomycetes sp. NU459]